MYTYGEDRVGKFYRLYPKVSISSRNEAVVADYKEVSKRREEYANTLRKKYNIMQILWMYY